MLAMRIPEDVICKVCQGVFCCAECRHKHEVKNHAIVVRKPIICATTRSGQQQTKSDKSLQVANSFETIYLFCPICEKRPLPLQPDLNSEMLIHIESHHLPLRCEKCLKIYNKIDDLKEFSKCMRPTLLCQSQESLTNQSCYTDEASKVTVTKAIMNANTSPMRRHDFNESHLTPISIINMRWKAKNKVTHEEFISDSVSSIKNLSSINNSSVRRSAGVASAVKGKVIRCSSTPVHLDMVFAKPKEQTFNATGGGHMSSIQYNSGCESDNSPAIPLPNSQALEPMNRYLKVCGARQKSSAVTPLRQVMSKSIQKAFAEHGLPASTAVRGSTAFQRKQMFDTTTSPRVNDSQYSPAELALDLRLSPVVRRSQSESEECLKKQIPASSKNLQSNEFPNLRRKILLSAQKLTTESIVITRTEHLASVSSSTSGAGSNCSMNSMKPYTSTNSSYLSATSNSTGGRSVFKSCSSVEIITSTTEEIKLETENVVATHAAIPPLTPITRIPGSVINKKLIKFETPKLEAIEIRDSQNSSSDVFFTPNATPMRKSILTRDSCENIFIENNRRKNLVKKNLSGRFSPLRRPSIRECAHSTAFSRIENITNAFDDDAEDYIDDEVFLPEELKEKSEEKSTDINNDIQGQQSGGLWSLMSSVLRLPSSKGSTIKDYTKNCSNIFVNANSNSIIKRCASIAGSLVRSKPLMDESELNSLKRKRTYTIDNQSTSEYLAQLNNSDTVSPTSDSLNTSSKRFRIQGRRPIDRMRLNS